jgi:hypothetical protein
MHRLQFAFICVFAFLGAMLHALMAVALLDIIPGSGIKPVKLPIIQRSWECLLLELFEIRILMFVAGLA